MKTLLMTGTLGFIFSNVVRDFVARGPWRIVGVDKAVQPYNLDNAFEHPDYRFYLADIADAHAMGRIFELERPDIVIGAAAESFVDDAISNITPFLRTNVLGTQVLIDQCLAYNASYMHISTDEVYGQLLSKDSPPWREDTPLGARNPYAASKACGELVVRAAIETHGLRAVIVRSCNVYGPRQKKANLVPHIICGMLEHKPIRLHGSGKNFREYIHVDDLIRALRILLDLGRLGEAYNVGTGELRTNLEMVAFVSALMRRSPQIQHIEDRKAHDFGYHVDSGKLRQLGWAPIIGLEAGLRGVIAHYEHAHGQAHVAA